MDILSILAIAFVCFSAVAAVVTWCCLVTVGRMECVGEGLREVCSYEPDEDEDEDEDEDDYEIGLDRVNEYTAL